MKAYLGLRDSARVYTPVGDGPAARLFGIDRRERGYANVHIA
jgi:hypothetical protein